MGVAMGLSSYSTTSLEDVAAQGSGNPYFHQVCILKDRKRTLQLLQRAESRFHLLMKKKYVLTSAAEAGYKAVFVSVDVPTLGRRVNEMRNSFVLPDGMQFPNILAGAGTVIGEAGNETGYGM